jgi:Flp pilus assembly protein TadD
MTPDFLYQFGLLMLRGGQPARAVRPLGEAAAAAPGDFEISFNYAEALARSGRGREAEDVLVTLLGDDPEGKAAKRLARILFRRGDYAGALELFRTLPQSPENLDRVAMSLHRLGRTEEAIRIQRGVADERPDWPTGLINLAVMLGAVGDLEEAERLLVRALELDPENVTAVVNLENLRRARGESGR